MFEGPRWRSTGQRAETSNAIPGFPSAEQVASKNHSAGHKPTKECLEATHFRDLGKQVGSVNIGDHRLYARLLCELGVLWVQGTIDCTGNCQVSFLYFLALIELASCLFPPYWWGELDRIGPSRRATSPWCFVTATLTRGNRLVFNQQLCWSCEWQGILPDVRGLELEKG